MKLIRNASEFPSESRGGAASIGNFDGVHRGHARIIERLVALARKSGGPALVFTFDPHPACLLRPNESPAPLTSVERKAELLADLGVDAVWAYPTDSNLLALSDREFFERIVLGQLATTALVEGSNFRFGRDRVGTVDRLRQFCRNANLELEVVEPVMLAGEVVSSSRTRKLLAEGRIDEARQTLTRPYRLRGIVSQGARRGATLGFPTANLDQVGTLIPGRGVYAGFARYEGICKPAAIHVGPNPTFGESHLKVEVHVIGASPSLYGQPLEVDFLTRIRDVRPFPDVAALKAQLTQDVAAASAALDEFKA